MAHPIDILVAIDIPTIAARFPEPSTDPAEPTPVDASCCFMLAPQSLVAAGQASDRLILHGPTVTPLHEGAAADDAESPILWGETVRWRTLGMAGAGDLAAFAYDLVVAGTGPHHHHHHRHATATLADRVVPVPVLVDSENTDPPEWTAQTELDYALHIRVPLAPETAVSLLFTLTAADPLSEDVTASGYYRWDGTIGFCWPHHGGEGAG